ncbi:hypothetical protein KIN20_006197 [Parelaphostrongylus tenuis]|uniref:Uncharacterized protein n=1 Tax=Parelaphostrongylus tenuis TaxID=148309 RepID=A0AAD5QKT0_PARTN|nr:hypothetical protein KIN20_006197 [Parelaphostrongylus tenuis]
MDYSRSHIEETKAHEVQFPKCFDNASGQEPVVEKDGTHDYVPCLATRYSTTFDDGLNESASESLPFVSLDRLDRTGAVNRLTKNNVDSGHRIKRSMTNVWKPNSVPKLATSELLNDH